MRKKKSPSRGRWRQVASGRGRYRWKDNIVMDPINLDCDNMDSINLTLESLGIGLFWAWWWLCNCTKGVYFLFLIQPTRCANYQILFCQKNLNVSGISFAHNQEFSTIHSTLVYFLQVCSQLPSRVRIVPSWTCLKTVIKPARNIPMSNIR